MEDRRLAGAGHPRIEDSAPTSVDVPREGPIVGSTGVEYSENSREGGGEEASKPSAIRPLNIVNFIVKYQYCILL